jgi:tight adherence protein B
MWKSGAEKQRQAVAMQRLDAALARFEMGADYRPLASPDAWQPRLLEKLLRRAGFAPGRRVYAWLAAPGLVLALAAGSLLGFKAGAAMLLLAYPLVLGVFLNWRIEHLREKVVEQLPDFIDSVVRIVSIGCSLELAFRNATEECREPLRAIFAQVLLRCNAGMALEDAMSQVAESSGVKDLKFVAAVFYLGVHYGGNANALLERIALTLRERERGQKELHAMTAEIRVSAWILSALPIVVGFLTLIVNPGYLAGMWLDQTGQKLLLTVGGLQIVGMFLLFRMAKI